MNALFLDGVSVNVSPRNAALSLLADSPTKETLLTFLNFSHDNAAINTRIKPKPKQTLLEKQNSQNKTNTGLFAALTSETLIASQVISFSLCQTC